MGTHPIFESDFDCLTDIDFGSIHITRKYMKQEKESELK